MRNPLASLILVSFLVNACTSVSLTASTNSNQPLTANQIATIEPTIQFTSSATAPDPTATPTATHTGTATFTPTLTASPTPYIIGPDNFPETVNPLTGLPVADINALNRRPMAVKVQLYPRGQRPVYGISMADVVYDAYQNDGLTRLHAIFYGADASQIGPVRSARLFDENIIQMYKALFAFGGAAKYVLNRFYNANYANRLVLEGNRNCPPLCRADPNGYNFLFTSSPELSLYALRQEIPNTRQDLDGMRFTDQPPARGEPGDQITTRYSISAYTHQSH